MKKPSALANSMSTTTSVSLVQIVIGEALAALKSGKYDGKEVAIGMGKYIGDCRLTHYSALLRKALDDAGYP